MKEISKQTLTGLPTTPYYKGGDNFMVQEGKQDMAPQNSQPTNPEHAEKTPAQKQSISPEKQAAARKAAIQAYGDLEKLPFDTRQAVKAMIEAGIPPVSGGADAVDKTGIQNPSIAAEIDTINNSIDVGLQPSLNVLTRGLEGISRLVGVDAAEKQTAIDRIKAAIDLGKRAEEIRREQSRPEEERERRFSLYFMPADLKLLSESPTLWLDEEFNKLYALAEEGQELNSPLIQDTQNKVSQAFDVIKHSKPEFLPEFLAQFTVRLHLLQTRTAIGYKNMDQIKGAAGELRAHGLLVGMTLEKGMVGAMFNRLQDLLESTRLSSNTRHHVMLEDAYKLQKVLIDEQMDFSKKGIGNFGSLRGIAVKEARGQTDNPDTWDDFTWATKMTDKDVTDNKLKKPEEQIERIRRIKSVNASITRSVRTAYDVFVASQRMAVVVARGKYLLRESSRYRSDPIGALNVYDMENLLFEKFDLYSPEQEEMVDRIKLDMAESYLKDQKKTQEGSQEELTREQKLDLGKRLFRDIFAVPDFFSSGWRIEGVIQALEQRFTKDRANDFALFMRLRHTGQAQFSDPEDKEKIAKTRKKREEIWGKIQDFRPDEIIRLFRERKNDKMTDLYKSMITIDSGLDLTSEEKLANRSDEHGGRGKDITVYDKFKNKYGSIIGLLRQEGFSLKGSDGHLSPKQINLSDLNIEQKKTADDFLGVDGAKQLMELTKTMQNFIGTEHLINDLLTNNNFADVYTRSIIVDDALLDKLEDEKLETNGANGNLGYAPLSKIIGEAGAGGDTLVRSWNDTENAAKAGNALIKFIKEEDLEKKMGASLEFASSAAAYNGLGAKGQAECVRYTMGTFLNLSKVDMMWDIIGLTSLGRVSISEVQRIFGPHAKAMSRDELRGHLDHLRGFLSSSITKAREELQEKKREAINASLSEDEEKEARDLGLSEHAFKAKKIKDLESKFVKDEKKSHEFYKDLENLLEVNAGDTAKRFGFRLILYLLLAAIGEIYMVGKSSFKESSK